jgi:hypothetical protein
MTLSSIDEHESAENGWPVLNVTSSGVLDHPLKCLDGSGATATVQWLASRYHLAFSAGGGWVQIPEKAQRMQLITLVNLGPTAVTLKNSNGSTMGTLAAWGTTSSWLEVGWNGITWSTIRWGGGWTAA